MTEPHTAQYKHTGMVRYGRQVVLAGRHVYTEGTVYRGLWELAKEQKLLVPYYHMAI